MRRRTAADDHGGHGGRVVHDEVAADWVVDQGPDPDYPGPGAPPTLYQAA